MSASSDPMDYSSSSDDDMDMDDLVIATHHQIYSDDSFAVPPAPAVLSPWIGIGGAGNAPATAASIDALPTVEVSEPCEVCAICKDDLPIAAAARKLPCGHLYHSSCILPWLEVHNSCPICRSRLPSGRQVVVPSSEQDPPATASSDQLRASAASEQGEDTVVLSV
ncbi:unnamed protein product [Urochloa decumbens]|uniref:RING-type domain-containing protein n=1 Tax=Urochloa decumbens TaxID=240449 RepID=A0ABC9B068_9POAL